LKFLLKKLLEKILKKSLEKHILKENPLKTLEKIIKIKSILKISIVALDSLYKKLTLDSLQK